MPESLGTTHAQLILFSICDVCICVYFSGFFWFLHARQRIFSNRKWMQQEGAEAEDVGETGSCTIDFGNGDPILSSCVYDAFAQQQVLNAAILEILANMNQCAGVELRLVVFHIPESENPEPGNNQLIQCLAAFYIYYCAKKCFVACKNVNKLFTHNNGLNTLKHVV